MAVLEGAKQLRSRFRAIEKVPAGMMREIGLRAVGNQKSLAPVRTGNMRRLIHLTSSSATSAVTTASAHYSAHVEFGTRVAQQNSHAETDAELHPLREVPRWEWPGDQDDGNRHDRHAE